MSPVRDEKPRVEREQTDESLRTEREKTDRALAERQAAVEEDADTVVRQARATADAVLVEARDKADEHLDVTGAPPEAHDVLADERAREDAALEAERAAADEMLERERLETSLALAKLLPLERVKTDRYLLTERVRSDDALSHRDDFLGIVSHDLRNLLGGIVLSAGVMSQLAEAHGDECGILEGTARIQRYAARMNRLIADLLDVASIDAGRLAVTAVPGDVSAIIAESMHLFEADAATKGLTLTSEAADGVPLIAMFDHGRILQVLGNVLSNAIKFTPAGGSVTIRAACAGSEIAVSVTDTGAGLPPTMHEIVFQRFWQARDNDSRGLGLGLYISRSIIDAHGGRIWVESEPGRGSTFTFTLPAAAV